MGMIKTVNDIRAAVDRMGEKLTTGHLVAVIQTLTSALHNGKMLRIHGNAGLTFLSVMGESYIKDYFDKYETSRGNLSPVGKKYNNGQFKMVPDCVGDGFGTDCGYPVFACTITGLSVNVRCRIYMNEMFLLIRNNLVRVEARGPSLELDWYNCIINPKAKQATLCILHRGHDKEDYNAHNYFIGSHNENSRAGNKGHVACMCVCMFTCLKRCSDKGCKICKEQQKNQFDYLK